MEAFLVSIGVIALGEMGDKTQLLAILLAVKFRRPVAIIAGIFVATLLNHGTAGLLGSWIADAIGPKVLRWVVGSAFLGMSAWVLVPDRPGNADALPQRFGVFGASVVSFFLAEMGDKTQIATVALAARYHDLFAVVAGTTLGILIADVPAVFIGSRMAERISMVWMHRVAAVIFAVLSVLALLNVGHVF